MFRAMVIDDDAAVRKLFRTKLSAEGWECREAANGRDGLEACRREKPDVLVLDVHLPDVNGIDLCRTLKADPELSHIRVLLASGEAIQAKSRTAGLEAGADDYVVKPFSLKEVFARLERLVGKGAR